MSPLRNEEETRLVAQIEALTHGEVTALDRQPRWRKAWYATVRREGAELPLYIRGDKQIDAEPYPGLDREATVLTLLASGGLPVPHVYGMARDPIGIVMDRVPGERDVATASDDAERQRIAEEYIELLAKMHALDIAPFIAAGIEKPEGAAGVSLSYLNAHLPLYERTKRGPQPLVEWALRWIQRNVPQHREVPRLIHGDPGQFLFAEGRVTCLYDFEATHIGDPMHDLAALRLRAGTEPLGADPDHLVRHYARITGVEIDAGVLSFHTAAFMLAAVMSMAGPLYDPRPADMQLEYQIWDVMCRRAMLWGMAEVMGAVITPSAPIVVAEGRSSMIAKVLDATIERIDVTDPVAAGNRESARALAQWARAEAFAGVAHEAGDLDRVAAIIGFRPSTWRDADEALEQFVLRAGPEHDAVLFSYFARQIEDRVAVAVPVRDRLTHYALTPVQL